MTGGHLSMGWDHALRCVSVHGDDAQRGQISEELGELLTAINRHRRGRAAAVEVVDEVADTIICALQAAVIAGADFADVAAALDRKIARQAARLDRKAFARGRAAAVEAIHDLDEGRDRGDGSRATEVVT